MGLGIDILSSKLRVGDGNPRVEIPGTTMKNEISNLKYKLPILGEMSEKWLERVASLQKKFGGNPRGLKLAVSKSVNVEKNFVLEDSL